LTPALLQSFTPLPMRTLRSKMARLRGRGRGRG
jgi:hypothetical protein